MEGTDLPLLDLQIGVDKTPSCDNAEILVDAPNSSWLSQTALARSTAS